MGHRQGTAHLPEPFVSRSLYDAGRRDVSLGTTLTVRFLGKDQRQYVVVAAGGGGYLGAAPGSKILAFTLP